MHPLHVDQLAVLKLQHLADPLVHQLAALKSVLAIHVQLQLAIAAAARKSLGADCSPRFSSASRTHAAIAVVQQLATQHQLVAARAVQLLLQHLMLLQLQLQHQWLTHMHT